MNGTFVCCLGVMLMFAVGCIVDRDEPCGARQVELEGGFRGCVCAPGYAWTADGKDCVACGPREVERDGQCVCDEGYARPLSGAACEAIEDAGVITDAAEPIDSGGRPTETGEGEACTSSADCADYYATFCQTLQAPNVCLVQGCATGDAICAETDVCCSFADFPLLASTNGLCVPAGSCISPGKPVTP